MKFCQDHWDRLRAAIADRGLDGLVARGGAAAAANVVSEIKEGSNPENFDPLMGAHWAIASNAMEFIKRAGGNPLYLMFDGLEDPVTGYAAEYEGRTWPRCPLCYINLVHEVSCKGGSCTLPKVGGYDWMIVRAADDMRDVWRKMTADDEKPA
jgi:hypothetical protein